MRRPLPPLNALKAFEATARHLSLKINAVVPLSLVLDKPKALNILADNADRDQ